MLQSKKFFGLLISYSVDFLLQRGLGEVVSKVASKQKRPGLGLNDGASLCGVFIFTFGFSDGALISN